MFGNGLFTRCIELIKVWKPQQNYLDELKYRDDLRDFLFKELNKPNPLSFGNPERINVRIESSRSLCDIAIDRSIGIELKFSETGKMKKAEIDRLYGQIAGHKKEYSQGIIVVLVGEVDDYSEAEVRERLEELHTSFNNSGLGLNQYHLDLINKSNSKQTEKPKPFEYKLSI
ncbi:MAG: hypothetical protein V2A62_01385 [Candidatus Woesearchaeota archaeon]